MHYGCHNRADYLPTYLVQDDWLRSGDYAVAVMKDVPFSGSQDCNYRLTELGKVDPRCEGCARKAEK